MNQVFISYSRMDIEFVKQLVADLQDSGFNIWYDLSGLEGGTQWGPEIQKAIEKSQYFILVLSPNSLKSKWVHREFLLAENRNIKVIPLQYQPCSLPMWLLDLEFIDMQGEEYKTGFKRLLRALNYQAQEKAVQAKPEIATKQGKPESEIAQSRHQNDKNRNRKQVKKEEETRLRIQAKEREALKEKQKKEKEQRQEERKVRRQKAWLKWKPSLPRVLTFTAVGILLVASAFLVPGFIRNMSARLQPTATHSAASTLVQINTVLPAATTSTSTAVPSVPVQPTATATPVPSWITDFAEPILETIKDRTPDLTDDFSYDQLLWSISSSGDQCENTKGTISNGALMLEADLGCQAMAEFKLTEKSFSNFAVEVNVDLSRLGSTYGAGIVDKHNDAIKIFRDGRWEIWSCESYCFSVDGGEAALVDPQSVTILYLSFGAKKAVYLNETPLTYFEDVKADTLSYLMLDIWSFSESSTYTPSNNYALFDNYKFWKLDDIPDLESLLNQ